MSSHPIGSAPRILILDDDLGFLVWLGHMLAASGYLPIPAMTDAEAKGVVKELGITVNLAIVNLSLLTTADFLKTLKGGDPSLKVIAIQDSPPDTTEVGAYHSRSRAGWLTTVRRVLGEGKT